MDDPCFNKSTFNNTPVYTKLKHQVQGRVRLKVRGMKNSKIIPIWLAHHLKQNPSVTQYKINPKTGSLICRGDIPDSSEYIWFVECKMRDLIHTLLEKDNSDQDHDIEEQFLTSFKESLDPNLSLSWKDKQRVCQSMQVREFKRIQPSQERIFTTKTCEEALSTLKSNAEKGLDKEQYESRLLKYGPNEPEIRKIPSTWETFKPQLLNIPVGLLLGSSALSIVSGGLLDAGMILMVIGANAAIGYRTERSAQKTILSIKQVKDTKKVPVLRNNRRKLVKPEMLVPGDIVFVEPGYVPADIRILKSDRLTADESKLTGEGESVLKNAQPLSHHSISMGDHHNMLYQGTIITGGHGLGIVTATGPYTVANKIASVVDGLKIPKTPLQDDLEQLGTRSVAISSAICLGVLGLGFWRGQGFKEMLQTTIALGVAAVPEGLPAVGISTLAIGVRRMRKHQVLVKRLPAVEALGGTDVLCFDKTGTVTENKMVLSEVRTFESSFFSEKQFRQNAKHGVDSQNLLKALVLASEATYKRKDDKVTIIASSTEKALLEGVKGTGLDPMELSSLYEEHWRYSRNVDQPYLVTMHTEKGAEVLEMNGGEFSKHPKGYISVKGNPDQVLSLCKFTIRKDGSITPLHLDDIKSIKQSNKKMAKKALRVLGVAFSKENNLEKAPASGLVWIGLVGLKDPVRDGIRKTVKRLRRAGIRICMLTGDQLETARATANSIKLKGKDQESNGIDASKMQDSNELVSELADSDVFARISPTHKLQIVKAMQDQGHRVGMIGDGVNDGPALRASDVGIAMGEGGTDAARHSSDIVIRDNKVETIIKAIAQGRSIRTNLSKSMHYMMSTNLSELLLSFGGLAIGIGCPLSPMQLLWINLLTDVAPAIGLALEDPERDIMKEPPVPPGTPILDQKNWKGVGIEATIIALNALQDYRRTLRQNGDIKQAESMSFLSLTGAQLAHLAAVKMRYHEKMSLNSPSSLAVLGGGAILGLAFGVPWLRNWIGLSSHSGAALARTALGVAGVTAINSFIASNDVE